MTLLYLGRIRADPSYSLSSEQDQKLAKRSQLQRHQASLEQLHVRLLHREAAAAKSTDHSAPATAKHSPTTAASAETAVENRIASSSGATNDPEALPRATTDPLPPTPPITTKTKAKKKAGTKSMPLTEFLHYGLQSQLQSKSHSQLQLDVNAAAVGGIGSGQCGAYNGMPPSFADWGKLLRETDSGRMAGTDASGGSSGGKAKSVWGGCSPPASGLDAQQPSHPAKVKMTFKERQLEDAAAAAATVAPATAAGAHPQPSHRGAWGARDSERSEYCSSSSSSNAVCLSSFGPGGRSVLSPNPTTTSNHSVVGAPPHNQSSWSSSVFRTPDKSTTKHAEMAAAAANDPSTDSAAATVTVTPISKPKTYISATHSTTTQSALSDLLNNPSRSVGLSNRANMPVAVTPHAKPSQQEAKQDQGASHSSAGGFDLADFLTMPRSTSKAKSRAAAGINTSMSIKASIDGIRGRKSPISTSKNVSPSPWGVAWRSVQPMSGAVNPATITAAAGYMPSSSGGSAGIKNSTSLPSNMNHTSIDRVDRSMDARSMDASPAAMSADSHSYSSPIKGSIGTKVSTFTGSEIVAGMSKSISFSQIVEEERRAREQSDMHNFKGNDNNPWYVQRRPPRRLLGEGHPAAGERAAPSRGGSGRSGGGGGGGGGSSHGAGAGGRRSCGKVF